ncbi:ROK family protein [Thermoanaerobacterium sp. RBIITD]|uniref:ROK family protein n=1 Tax=Thermoanaerobacterium sp. RBIITD TaxID=1550240 RepID=UPI000BB8A52C|nr:ROK family protein [Thermoanaerobacterium sp. RBIITD]
MNKVIGIDIGGTKILGGVIDSYGNLLKSNEVLTEAKLGRDHILKKLFSIIDTLIDKDIEGIGIGSAGRINFNTGEVVYATDNLPGWTGLNLKNIIEEKYSLPTIVDNDVNAAAIGESWVGAGKGFRNMVMLTLGTGVGGAIMLNGKVVRGYNWSAGEIGHTVLFPDGRKCNCGHKGCAEQYISGTALYKRYNKIIGHNMVNDAEEVFSLFKKSNNTSKIVINEFLKSLSLLILNIRNFIDPEVIILGGGVINSKDLWWDALKLSLKSDINIIPAKLNNYATMFGAAKLILLNGGNLIG